MTPILVAIAVVLVFVGVTFLVRHIRPHPVIYTRTGHSAQQSAPPVRVTIRPEATSPRPPAPALEPRETAPFDSIVSLGPSDHAHVAVERQEGK